MEIPEIGQRIAFATDNVGTIIELAEPGTWPSGRNGRPTSSSIEPTVAHAFSGGVLPDAGSTRSPPLRPSTTPFPRSTTPLPRVMANPLFLQVGVRAGELGLVR